MQWTVTRYLLITAALLLLAGAPADRFKRKRVLATTRVGDVMKRMPLKTLSPEPILSAALRSTRPLKQPGCMHLFHGHIHGSDEEASKPPLLSIPSSNCGGGAWESNPPSNRKLPEQPF